MLTKFWLGNFHSGDIGINGWIGFEVQWNSSRYCPVAEFFIHRDELSGSITETLLTS
jgi:hypothetical protein